MGAVPIPTSFPQGAMGWIALFNAALQQLNVLGSYQGFGFLFLSGYKTEGTPMFNFPEPDDGFRKVTSLWDIALTGTNPKVHFMGVLTDNLFKSTGSTQEKDILEYGRFAYGGFLDYEHSNMPGDPAYAMHDGSGLVAVAGPARDAVGVWCSDDTILIWPKL